MNLNHLRTRLLTVLLYLKAEAHLPNGRQSKADAHPQSPNPHLTFENKKFRGDIRLSILRLPGSGVTDEMLAKGSAAGKLPDAKVDVWITAILEHKYLIVKTSDSRLQDQESSEVLEEEPGDHANNDC